MIKEHILDIATSEFAILGYSALSMNNLAKKLEINKATIYYHFKDKKSLYNEVILSLIQLNKDEREAIANSTLEPKEKFKQYIKSLIHTMGDNPNIIPLTLREMAGFDIGIESNISNNKAIGYFFCWKKKRPCFLKKIRLEICKNIPISHS